MMQMLSFSKLWLHDKGGCSNETFLRGGCSEWGLKIYLWMMLVEGSSLWISTNLQNSLP